MTRRASVLTWGLGLALAVTGCAGPTSTTGPAAEVPAPASSVGEAYESEVPDGVDEPDDRHVPAFSALSEDERRALVRLPASESGTTGACGPDDVTAELGCDYAMPGWGPFGIFPQMVKGSMVVTLEGGEVELFNFSLPHVYHSITVTPTSGKSRTERVYKHKDFGEEWWTR